jgi:benzoyl-CoA reductase/2-hydroxyglutaryl-CoA dehydratase subunit BcrC/BadD/HgdB
MEKIAYFDSSHDFPEEIVMAAGYSPVKLLGDVRESNEPADQYLSSFFCPAARSFLTQALGHSKEWAGIMIAHGCDATNRQFDIYKMHVDTPYLYWVYNPLKVDKTAKKFYKKELKRMIDSLEKQFNIKITADKLKAAIAESNEIKKRLQELSKLRGSFNISNKEYFEICAKCVTLPKADVLKLLDSTIADWKKKDKLPDDLKKIFLVGSDTTFSEWMDLLDECSLRVIRDEVSIGERYFGSLIPDLEDPLDALVDYYFNIPKPATKMTLQGRIDNILSILKETKVDGVLSQNLKFCEPYALDAPTINNMLKDNGYKVIHLEREFTSVMDQQLKTRLEAFAELL